LAERLYIIPSSRDARKRHYHKTVRGRVVNFVVPLEVEIEEEWRPVVRYDCSHRFTHRDAYNLSGRQRKEEDEQALTFADEDMSRPTRFGTRDK
jgi:hypothetical protein